MIDGKADSMGLGPVATVSLAKAREKAEQARDLVREGINPREAPRRRAPLTRKVAEAKAISFKQCAAKYIEATRPGWKNEKHANQWLGTFTETRRGRKVFPAATQLINDLPIDAIDTGLVSRSSSRCGRRRRRRQAGSAGASRRCSTGRRCGDSATGRIRPAGRGIWTRSCRGAPS